MAKKGDTFVPTEKIKKLLEENANKEAVNPIIALIPIVVIIVTLNILKWNVNVAMLCGVLAAYLIFWKRIDDKVDALTVGAQNSISSIMNIATAVGIGGVAKLTSTFTMVKIVFFLSMIKERTLTKKCRIM